MNTNWNNFNNADKPGTNTNVDDTGVQQVEQQGQQQINGIESALQNIQAPTMDLTDFSTTFAWIWQTIIYLFTTHNILMTTMVIILSLGFLKTVLGR
jgi:ABC-type siderophore export system fused ATPase/permease subunit